MNSRTQAPELKDRVDLALGWVVVILMGTAVINVLWQVFTRYVLGSPSGFTDELARYLLIWVGLLGASYATGQRLHLAIDLLPTSLTGRRRDALGLIIDALIFLFALLVMVYGGLRLVGLTLMLEQTSPAMGLPLGYVYLILPISGLVIMFYSGLFMIDHTRGLRGQRTVLDETDEASASAFADEFDAVDEDDATRAAGVELAAPGQNRGRTG